MPAAFPMKSSIPNVARQHGVRGVPCLLPDLERRDTRPSRARREAGAGYDQISRSDRTSLTTRLAAASPKNDQGPGFGGLSRGAIAPCRYVTTSGGNGSVQALGDYEDLSVNNDGSLDLYIQSDAPEADRKRTGFRSPKRRSFC
jgi:hypothetical protein